ncbi:hypothetical protein D9C73_002612 [Collichthys lucidus]|uniref:Ig-like domain-containing protein n=1 Tax=Collichthys lucidus TaxID=240159 RepID=A0A4U5U3G5_COLLU|nr:hypothetical protein D9C73_002612 [Collichthys lucidus]
MLIDGMLIDGMLIDGMLIDGMLIDGMLIDGMLIDGILIDGSPHSSSSNVLSIDSVASADGGLYTCSVSNSRGTINVEFDVTVEVSTYWKVELKT